MESSHCLFIFCAVISLAIFFPEFCFSADTITPLHSIEDGDTKTTLVSSGETFELGFFSPETSTNRYIGIWYKVTPDVVVWVANRNNPLNDSFGEFAVGENGNLVLLDGAKSVVWSSNASRVAKDPVAQLLENGNLVLREIESTSPESFLWQSFDFPADTQLQGMKLGWDSRRGLDRYLTSWKGVGDPSEGNYTFRIDINGLPQLIVEEGSTRKRRVGPWNGVELIGLNDGATNVFRRIFIFDENESSYYFVPKNNSVITRVKLKSDGNKERSWLQSGSNKWVLLYTLPYDLCDHYGYCGANGICRVNTDPICECLQGFTPISQEEWDFRNWSKGCVRKTPLDCHKGDGFVKLDGLKLPDLLQFWLNKSMSLEECKAECLKNCSCVAYSNSDVRDGGSGCLMWFGELVDVRELRVKGTEQHIHVKLSALDIKSIRDETKKRELKIKLAVSISSGLFIFALLLCCITWRLRQRAKENLTDESADDIELPLFDFATIKVATHNFSEANMIGEGGFGRVYKGNLLNGPEIAVKRLTKISSQELKEQFKNEVQLIAKLQHKNLVALLGCCVQGDERMLLYEYMPNKSLDNYIFDKTGSNLSSWEKNFEIIMGIARGLLYLHQDSKLPIIHRDLKAANVLLDSNMNPKISDFGLARIFGGDEKEDQTKNIVGSYGYISPEYAVEGIFSVKFDVFSFGVLLLEIVSGKRNRRFSHRNHNHNLLGHAWLLWNKGEALELMDLCFQNLGVESQVLRCIQIGLLCVQNNPEYRPTMNYVVLMLSNEAMKLPDPKMPGFFVETCPNNSDESSTSRIVELHSVNKMTFTLEGR